MDPINSKSDSMMDGDDPMEEKKRVTNITTERRKSIFLQIAASSQ
jgi:hypothetical protein